MPEIGEVARIVHFIRKHLVGKTLAVVKAQHDENVFGKVGTSAAEFEKSLTGKKVVDAGQQGKYFWLIMSTPPHPLCHFGMAGWFEIRHENTWYKKLAEPRDHSIWPPKHWRFSFESAEEPKCEAAFIDVRRFGRVRLIDCAAEDIRRVSPLKENGPDPVIDRELVTEGWLAESLSKKKLHVKTFLLDQANISGIGNWVGDEILYHAAIHPETYTQSLAPAQISRLYTCLHNVTSLAVATLADSDKFPESWLFKHRWGKGKKDSTNALPSGGKITFINVGGRTSAVVASMQKKTGGGGVAKRDETGDEHGEAVAEEEDVEEKKTKPKSRGKKSAPREDSEPEPADPESKVQVPQKSAAHPRKGGRKTTATVQDPAPPIPDPTPAASSKAKTKRKAAPPTTDPPSSKKRKLGSAAEDTKEVPPPQAPKAQNKKARSAPTKSGGGDGEKTKPKSKKSHNGEVGSASAGVSKEEDEDDIWEGRRRSRRVSGRNPL